jgi:1-acyl-sn-glycerol-3-phosphate acyltransferase
LPLLSLFERRLDDSGRRSLQAIGEARPPRESVVAEADRAQIEARVLEIVAGLTSELQGSLAPTTITLDQSLERDLAIGSLERVELLLRLEQMLGVRLSDTAMMEAENPRDLARAVLMAGSGGAERVPERVESLGAASAAPTSAGTLVEALRWHAERSPERVHIFLGEEHGGERPITYRALWERAVAVSAGLRERKVGPGDSVALMLRTEEPFFAAFFGTLLAGAVPVPIYPPFRADRIEEYARRQLGILANAEARLLVTFAEAERVAGLLRSRARTLSGVVTVEQLVAGRDMARPAPLHPDDPALIQYTSGSTGDPKGVLLTHANLLANIRAIGQALPIRPDDVGVSWLPLYHDMGLIGAWLGSLYFGIPIAIISPLGFLARPARWLWALHAHRGTVSPAPNFAFDLCVKKIADDEIQGLDLSAWRLALNGSEPVSAETIERFTRRFAPYGFRPEAMCPTYGLAEASVGLTVSPSGRRPRVEGRVVSCGVPLPGHEVRIVDADGRPVSERIEGRVEFRGPSVTSGYFRNIAATRAVFRDGWCDSGDLGFWANGELFVTGRRKDIIIKAGRNLHPQEVEELVGEVPGIRKGCVAVFGVADPAIGTERLVVVAESRETAPEAREHLRAQIVERVIAGLGIPPDTVAIHGPGTVLKTPSGKIRRSATRDAYRAGRLGLRPSARRQWTRLLLLDLAAKLRRLPGAARALAYAGWVGAVLALAFPLLWALVLLLPRGRAVDRTTRVWSRIVLATVGCALRVEGLANLPARGAALFVCNHASYVDVVALLAAIPAEFRFVAKRELTGTSLIGTVIRKAGHLTVDRVDLSRGVADAENVTRVLRQGTSFLFFPEGTFVRAPGIMPFRLGAFKAAVDVQCPVIPVGLRGTRDILPAYRWLPRRSPITVTIGAPITPEGTDWREMVRIRDLAREAIARAAGERRVEERRA